MPTETGPGSHIDKSERASEFFALKKVNECGPAMAETHPNIVLDAKNLTLAAIAEKYSVAELYGVSQKIAKSIVKRALEILVPDKKQREEIFSSRLRQARYKSGIASFRESKGIHNRSKTERKNDAQNAGQVGGARSRDLGVGIFGLSKEELKEHQKEGIKKRKGGWFNEKNIIEGMTEAEYATMLAQDPNFRRGKGRNSGSLDHEKICMAVNKRYGKNRTQEAVKAFFRNERRRIRKENKEPLF